MITPAPIAAEKECAGPGNLAKESTGTDATSTKPIDQEEVPAMKTTSSVTQATPAVKIRPDWATITEVGSLADGTPTLIHSFTFPGTAWMVTVEREDLIGEDGVLRPGASKVHAEFQSDGSTPWHFFGYAEALRAAGLLLDQIQAAQ